MRFACVNESHNNSTCLGLNFSLQRQRDSATVVQLRLEPFPRDACITGCPSTDRNHCTQGVLPNSWLTTDHWPCWLSTCSGGSFAIRQSIYILSFVSFRLRAGAGEVEHKAKAKAEVVDVDAAAAKAKETSTMTSQKMRTKPPCPRRMKN